MANITGEGTPTRKTLGAIGDIYTDINTRKQYKCIFAYRNDGDKDFDCEWKQIKGNNDLHKEKLTKSHKEIKNNDDETIRTSASGDASMSVKRRDYSSYGKKNR